MSSLKDVVTRYLAACMLLTTFAACQKEPAHIAAEGANVSVKIENHQLTPSAIELEPGTTVNWINASSKPVRVKFKMNAVSTSCKEPRGFVLNPKAGFVSGEIQAGGVASLCFLEKQSYVYEVDEGSVSDVSPGELEANASNRLQGKVEVN